MRANHVVYSMWHYKYDDFIVTFYLYSACHVRLDIWVLDTVVEKVLRPFTWAKVVTGNVLQYESIVIV